MKKIGLASLIIVQSCLASQAWAQERLREPAAPDAVPIMRDEEPVKEPEIAKLTVKIGGIEEGKPIPAKFAYCAPDGHGRTKNGGNISPAIGWSGVPDETKSLAVIVVDPDVPVTFDIANKPDHEIPVKFSRQKFYHWILVDIPPGVHGLLEGKNSNGITPGGKPAGKTGYGVNGQNDYARVYPGTFGGYDGPCPPWNDLRLHHYHFIVYALDISSIGLPSPLRGVPVETAMAGHILAKGEVVGTYSDNPRWLSK